MKKILLTIGALALLGTTAGCGSERRTTTTTTRETIQPRPEEPVTIQKKTTTRTETRTAD
jgi:hypothetical protein